MGDEVPNWRAELSEEDRHTILQKIIVCLRDCITQPDMARDDPRISNLAIQFEEKIYQAAPNAQTYFTGIAKKMFELKTKALSKVGYYGTWSQMQQYIRPLSALCEHIELILESFTERGNILLEHLEAIHTKILYVQHILHKKPELHEFPRILYILKEIEKGILIWMQQISALSPENITLLDISKLDFAVSLPLAEGHPLARKRYMIDNEDNAIQDTSKRIKTA